MARGRRSIGSARRGPSATAPHGAGISRPRSLRPIAFKVSPAKLRLPDRRLWRPDGSSIVVPGPLRRAVSVVPGISRKQRVRVGPFLTDNPVARVAVCVRRAMRRGVMFAKGGAGFRVMRRGRRGPNSHVRC